MGATPLITTNNPQNTRSTKPDQASGDASSRNEKSGNLASCLLVGGVLFQPLAIRYDAFPGHRGYDTPGSQKALSAKRCIKTRGLYHRPDQADESESTERQKVH